MTATESSNSIDLYLREILKIDLLTPQQEVELAELIKKGDAKAREQMIKANLRLVVKIAREYANYGVPLADLISEGNIGLMRAVEKFDPGKGGKLSTYASWWIKQSIKRALSNQGKTVRLPVHTIDKLARIRRITASLTEELGREPSDEEVSEILGIPLRKLALLKQASQRPASFDAPITEDGATY
ncbi:sigma-70 family RNA polymerase sigma factor, partial [Akkermansiaceae bacterium]|nr:sigma-70 family RNA polymerase sigma factor [Akkermansiaceae bacterium]